MADVFDDGNVTVAIPHCATATLVCPVCAERVSRIRPTPTAALVWTCPNAHHAAREPISYGAWLASVTEPGKGD